MEEILIYNVGCDDETITIMNVSEKELDVLIEFGKLNNKNSKYQCQPSIAIYKGFEAVTDEDGDFCYYKTGRDLLKED